MASPPTSAGPGVRFEPDEKPPWPIAAGLALQYAILALGGVVLTVAIVFRSAGQARPTWRGGPSARFSCAALRRSCRPDGLAGWDRGTYS